MDMQVTYAIAEPFEASVPVSSATAPSHDATHLPLKVFAPTGWEMPVVVYIHGGRYTGGSFDEAWIRPEVLNNLGIIVVSIEYRTGLEGFVPFFKDTPHHYRGVDDCVRALEWVQHSIESYGGDPTNVTVVGQSAGAGIALWLARKDHYQGLFRRVWAISPAFPRGQFSKRKWLLRSCLSTPITARGLAGLSASRRGKGFARFAMAFPTDLPLGPAPFKPTELAQLPIVATTTDQEMFPLPDAQSIDRSGLVPLLRPLLKVLLGVPHSWQPNDRASFTRELVGHSMITRWVNLLRKDYPYQHHLWTGVVGSGVHHCDDIPWLFGDPDPNLELHQDFVTFVRGRTPSWPNQQTKQWRKPDDYPPR